MRYGSPGEIVHRPERQPHQTDEEESGEGHDAVDHLLLGDQVHEITGHQKRFRARNHQRQANVHCAMFKLDVGGPNREDCADDQGKENIQITADVVAEVIVCLGVCLGVGVGHSFLNR